MENKVIFSESQRFKAWWLWIIVAMINAFFVYGIYQQVYLGKPYGSNPMSNTGLIITSSIMLAFSIVFFNVRLETKIKNDGIYIRFFPIHLKFRHYSWNSLSKVYLRKYSPISEYGGWGIRLGFRGRGRAFNIAGSYGIQLEFLNGKKLLIGTQKTEEIKTVLNAINKDEISIIRK